MESPQELGLFLRTEREKQGLTIEQVASATKIAVKYLHALEADHYTDLPAKPFVRGFVSSYARFIGLNPREVLRQFDPFIDSRSGDRPNKEGGHKGYAFESKDGDQRSRMYLSIALGAMTVLGVVALALKPSLRGGKKHGHLQKLKSEETTQVVDAPVAAAAPTGDVTAPPVAPISEVKSEAKSETQSAAKSDAASLAKSAPTPMPSPTPTPVLANTAAPEASAAPTLPTGPGANPADPLDSGKEVPLSDVKHKLNLKAAASIWVRYQVDDRPVRKFIMRKDAVLILKAKTKLIFQISNPRSGSINYNGKGFKPVTDAQGVQEIGGTPTLLLGDVSGLPQDAVFPGEKQLPTTPDPSPETPAAPTTELSTPNP